MQRILEGGLIMTDFELDMVTEALHEKLMTDAADAELLKQVEEVKQVFAQDISEYLTEE